MKIFIRENFSRSFNSIQREDMFYPSSHIRLQSLLTLPRYRTRHNVLWMKFHAALLWGDVPAAAACLPGTRPARQQRSPRSWQRDRGLLRLRFVLVVRLFQRAGATRPRVLASTGQYALAAQEEEQAQHRHHHDNKYYVAHGVVSLFFLLPAPDAPTSGALPAKPSLPYMPMV